MSPCQYLMTRSLLALKKWWPLPSELCGTKSDLENAVLVPEEGLVAVAKVEAPYPDVFIRGAGHDELAIGRDIHAEDGELVAVKVEVRV